MVNGTGDANSKKGSNGMLGTMQRHVYRRELTRLLNIFGTVHRGCSDVVCCRFNIFFRANIFTFPEHICGITPSSDGDRKALKREGESLTQGRSMAERYPKQKILIMDDERSRA